jgi:starch synthase
MRSEPDHDRNLATFDVIPSRWARRRARQQLQQHFKLTESPRAPLMGVIARLVEQKGIDLILKAADELLSVRAGDSSWCSAGAAVYHRGLEEVRRRYQAWVCCLGDEGLAHRIEAGADMFLMPSEYEPSGLNQLYSMKYGIAGGRATVGWPTLVDCTPETLMQDRDRLRSCRRRPRAGRGSGPSAALYRERPADWLKVVRCAMRQDWSWDRSAVEYEALYRRLTG